MKLDQPWLKVYGDISYRGKCPQEGAEQITFFSKLRKEWPQYGELAIHPKNEGKRTGKDFMQLDRDKALGLVAGASDIIIPLGFACEMKRRDHTQSTWQKGQVEYLKGVYDMGGFACVALGWEAAWEAFNEWRERR